MAAPQTTTPTADNTVGTEPVEEPVEEPAAEPAESEAEAGGVEVDEPEVEIPTVEPDWSETLRDEGPGVMMQKLCGFKLSHAEKTPEDPAERCA